MLNNGKKCTEKWLPFEFWYYGKSLGSSQLIRRDLALVQELIRKDRQKEASEANSAWEVAKLAVFKQPA